VFCRSLFVLFSFFHFLLDIVGYVLLRFMNSDYPFVSSNSSCKLTGQKKRLWNIVVRQVWRYERGNYKSHDTENIIRNPLNTCGELVTFVVLLLDHMNTSIPHVNKSTNLWYTIWYTNSFIFNNSILLFIFIRDCIINTRRIWWRDDYSMFSTSSGESKDILSYIYIKTITLILMLHFISKEANFFFCLL
jgi:hypothetical protein